MDQNNAQHRKKELVSKQVKYLIAVASVAGTVGLWGLFSKADTQAVTTQNIEPTLPVLPTLVALNPSTEISSPSVAVTADNSLSSLPVVTQAPVVAPTTGMTTVYQVPAPVTNTRTSR